MKRIIYFLLMSIVIIADNSCKKTNNATGVASINIIHAAPAAPPVYIYFTAAPANYYLSQTSLGYGSGLEFPVPSGDVPLTLVSSDDTTKPLLQSTLNLTNGGLYSLYLIDLASKTDTLFVKDKIPVQQDSSGGVRFINLSPDSRPISVNLEGNPPTQMEFSGLNYKTVTPFRSYAGTNGIISYNFELRDQATGDLITTFTWNFNPFANYTIVITGSEDPSSPNPINVFQVNNF